MANVAELSAGTSIVLNVTIERDSDEADESAVDYTVVAPLYPLTKAESWWAVVGEPATKTLLAIKKIVLQQRHTVALDFTLPMGPHDLTLSVVSDSYVGADREFTFTVQVAEGDGDSSEEDSSEEDEDMRDA